MDKLNLTIENGSDVTIRTGEALKLSHPVPTVQSGVSFNSLVSFAKMGIEYGRFDVKEALAIADFEKGEITFKSKYDKEFTDVITASLQLSVFLERFKINSAQGFQRSKFADLIKFNRRFIELPNWQELFAMTKNISVNQVTNISIQDKNNKGSQKHNFNQENTIDYPESIRLKIPIFKNLLSTIDEDNTIGYQVIDVDTQLEVVNGDLNVCLVSPELEEIIESTKESVLSECMKELDELKIRMLRV